ncbi:T9SS type A sorting domain-containing protein [Balneola sp. MJW-20]|uniref:T9SS type A sorting domain-containing protein n=1 Tax=Gracilimonas aurantiaca TaxID=3234185 RepID=UPI003466DC35
MRASKIILPITALCILIGLPVLHHSTSTAPAYEKKTKTMEDRIRTNEGRAEYFFNLMRDPATNSIPNNIRSLELEHARDLPVVSRAKSAMDPRAYTFTEIGPNDVGGRTRALAVDLDDPSIILAGGVSGGVWRSTDSGNTWTQVTDPSVINSVTFITQDPRAGFRDNWYFSSGEFSGNSAGSRGGGGFYYGNGIFRSTDGGLTWTQIATTDQSDNNSFNSPFDYISKILVSPTTGTVFIASNGFGIYRSTDGLNFTLALGGFGEHQWADLDIDDSGNIIASISEADACGSCSPANAPGVYYSDSDGVNWTDITPTFFPAEHARSVISISPSTPNEVFVLTNSNNNPKLSYIDLNDSANNEDRTANLPDYGSPAGNFNLQGGYNMVVEVHPTDPDIVITGGTNLYISFDGYTTAQPTNAGDMWIGGYNSDNTGFSLYENHHPDQHVISFDPVDPNKVWSGHDGGLAYSSNITSTPGSWVNKNNGYNVTQFYDVSLFRGVDDPRVVGGTQDNGSPFFNFDTNGSSTASVDISSGDGSYSDFTSTYAYVSSQRGRVLRLTIKEDGSLTSIFNGPPDQDWTFVAPSDASGQLFIHPFEIDPYFTGTMYYPESDSIWINNNTGGIPLYQGSTMEGWSKINEVSSGVGTTITALEASVDNPRSLLYFAGYSNNSAPTFSKLPSATSNTNQQIVNIPGAAVGAYPHDISINPTDGNEVMVVFANYNVPSIFHSTDGGTTWSDVEGNLSGDIFIPGPSVRNAAIAQTPDGPVYFVGTSTGLYSTTQLDGSNTTWTRQAEDLIGTTVVESLDLRPDDNVLAVATHGRGIFIGEPGIVTSNEDGTDGSIPTEFELSQNYPNPFNPTTNISFSLPANSNVNLTVYNINGQKVAEILNGQFMGIGNHSVSFDAGDLASGVYIYRISARSLSGSSDFTMSRKMTLIK